ncbi:UNVERIFIED_CONTAM: hypothetical protein FKN15_018982 [Acipenser sinensis]
MESHTEHRYKTNISILSRTGKKETQDASNLAVPMTMCLFPVPFPLTPSLRPQVSSINPSVTRSLLYSVLRDTPSDRGQQSRDAQLSDYPSLDYQGLYVTLVTVLDLVPLLQHGQHDLGQSIFYTTTCLLPFLGDDILSTLPYTMISTLATFPPFLHKDIVEYLSTSFLPMAILGSNRRGGGVPAYVNLSASSMLMIAMQYTSNPVYHCQLLECLMKYKQEVWKDLLYVIAYGPSQVKPPAVQMLFHYWPNLKPPGAISEYRGLQYTAWNPIHCQHIECHNAINKPAVKMCIDPSHSVALGDKPPPLYICEECSQRIAGDHAEWLIDVLLPQAGCCGHHGNRPVRYCKRCHVNHHSSEVGAAAETHLYQTSPPPINTRECGAEELVCTVEAVISLLKEAEFHAELREYEMNRRRQMGLSSSHHSLDNTDFDNKDDDQHDQRLLSQFGIWFLVSLCTPSENTPTESLARLVSMVFQWFHSTAYMMDDEVGSLVEKLKPQFVTKWLKTVCDVRFDVMVMCLLPKPVEFARVLSELDIVVPLQLLIGMFSDGLNSVKELANQRKARANDLAGNLGARRVSVVSDPGRHGQNNTLSPFPSPFPSPLRCSPFHRSPFKHLSNAAGHRTLDLDCEEDDMNLSCFILMFNLILKQEMPKFEEPDILFNMLNCLKILCLHGECLYTARKDHPHFLAYAQDKMLIPSLWRVLTSEFSQLASLAVPQLLHALSLPHGADIFWGIVNSNFNSKDWKKRFEAVERVAVLCRFLDIASVTKNHLLKYSLAHAFCCFLAAVEDVNPAVATRARLLLDTIKRPALQAAITAVRTNVANLSDVAMWKIKRARFARNRQKSVRSLRDSVKGLTESKRAHSLPETLSSRPLRLTRHEQSAPTLGDMIDHVLPGQSTPEDDTMIKDPLPEDAGIDHQTVHHLITVLMKFMAKDKSSAEVDIGSAKAFNTVKRHLYVLLGYDQQEGCFMIAPQKMRTSTCFNAFIAGISLVMDYNIHMGKHLLPLVVQVLKYCTCPQLRHYFQQPPRCSLWSLRPHIRQMWLKTLLVVLYKYPYRDMDISKIVLHLIHITINTLNAQYHSCKPHTTAGPLYSDNSNNSRYSEKEKEEDSVFDESDIHDTPTGACNKESQTFFARLKRIGGSKSVKYQPVEMNAQKSEIELSEYRDASALQDSILRCVREESIKKKRLQLFKQKSLDIGNADSILFNLDEHRRKSCIDRCQLDKHGVAFSACNTKPDDHCSKASKDALGKAEANDPHEKFGQGDGSSENKRPVIPEVRLSYMETSEDKVDSPGGHPPLKEDPDLIDLSSDSTSAPEKRSIISTSDSDSLVFEPLPPLRIVESDEEYEMQNLTYIKPNGKVTRSPSTSNTLGYTPLVQVKDHSKDCKPKGFVDNTLLTNERRPSINPMALLDCKDLSKPAEFTDLSNESPMTLKQKRYLLKKSVALPEISLDDNCEIRLEEIKLGVGTIVSPSVKTVFLNVPRDVDEPAPNDSESDSEQMSNTKPEDENEEAEFKIQIVPRQKKHRKIAVSAIQREYLDISFNMLDKLGDQQGEPDQKGFTTLEMPRESASAPTLEAAIPETNSHSSISSATKSSLLSAPSTVSMFVPAPEEFTDDQPTTMTDRCHDCGAVLEEYDEESLGLAVVVLSMFIHLSPDLAAPLLLDIMQSVGRCHDCGAVLEEYDEESLGLAVVVLSMFIHLSPDLAAPLLLDIMQSVGRLASSTSFSGQAESMMIPGNAAGVAKQFLRCVFHQLAPNGILPQLFQSNIKDGSFLRTLASSLMDFNELSSVAALSMLLEGLNNKKSLPGGAPMLHCLENIATFMEALPMDSPSSLWTTICNQFQTFLTKLPSILPLKCCLDSSLRIIICLLKIPTTNAARSLLEPFSKLLGFVIQHAVFSLPYLAELCGLCYRGFNKERDKFYLSRSVVLELLQALKFKSPLPDTNLLLLVQCITAAMECMRQYINELLDFIADMHTLTKLKSHMKTCCQPLHEDTFGGNLKVGLAQIAAMEISKGNHRDNKAVIRYLPWLYHPPSAMQQGPKEFIECVSHIRLLSWLLLGSLTHSALNQGSTSCMPIPLDAGSHISDHLIVILIGFPEQSKMVEMVCLHVISLMEALQECNSTIFVKLIPMWLPMIQSNLKHLSAGLQLRLQAIQNNVNHQYLQGLQGCAQTSAIPSVLRKWLQCTQFKMAQVEIQSSEAVSQFYPM